MVDIRGGLGGIVGGFWSGSSTSSISSSLHLIQTPSISSRNVLLILLELQPHFILGPFCVGLVRGLSHGGLVVVVVV